MKNTGKKKISIMSFSRNKFNVIELFLVFIMALLFGVIIGQAVFHGNKNASSLTTSTSSEVYEIEDVYNTIISEYIDEVDKNELKEAAINGMISSLEDKHSIYFDKTETELFQDELNGYFTGLGISVYKDDEKSLITISDIFKGSPAEKAGLKSKDKFLKINGKDVTKSSTEELSNMIKGKQGTFIIVVQRDNEEKEVKVSTGKVDLPSVSSKIINKNNKKIAYVNISVFASNTADQLKEELKNLEKQSINDLIIDLRYNPGGELGSVIDIASQFLDKDVPVIQIKKKSKVDIRYSTGNTNKKYNIVVLVNKSSASGSEALAAALNEQLNVELVGTTTYGKGTVQKTKQLPNGNIIKYTVETWTTSKGNSIEGKGINPTVEIKQSDKYYATLKDADDVQLQKAIALLAK